MKNYKIYCLIDPRFGLIRYVGCTARSLNERLAQHYNNKESNCNVDKFEWINELKVINIRPIIAQLQECDEYEYENAEKYWISVFPNLLNRHEGGSQAFSNQSDLSRNLSAVKHKKPIVRLEYPSGKLIDYWDSAKDAYEALNIKTTAINNVLRGDVVRAGGFAWQYLKDFENGKPITLSKSIKLTKVLNKETNEEFIFGSIKEASLFIGSTIQSVHQQLYRTGVYNNEKFSIIKLN